MLLAAPAADAASGAAVVEFGATRAFQEARLRAVRRLSGLGLVWTGRVVREVQARRGFTYRTDIERSMFVRVARTHPHSYAVRAVWLSPLGAVVVDQHRAALADGGRIRWAPSTLAERVKLSADALLGRFAVALDATAKVRLALARQAAQSGIAAVATPIAINYVVTVNVADAVAAARGCLPTQGEV